jgi:hypothetical protein
MGDGILAYFGFPRAHEDDAERAVRAALDIVTAVDRLRAPESLKVRVGVATGLVVVGDLIGGGASQEQAVVGDTPNLAARLQALAEPGTIVVAASTRRLLGDLLGKRYGLAYGASNLFKQFSEPFAEPRILKFASGNLAIHPAFILAYAMVACSPTRQQRRQFHCAASQNIDDKLLKKTDRLVVPIEPLSTRIKHPHQESGAQQEITGEFRKSSKTQSVNTDFGESNSQQTATSDSYDSCIFKFDKSGVGRIFVGNRKLRQGSSSWRRSYWLSAHLMGRIPDNVYRHDPENRSTDRNVHLMVLRVPVGACRAQKYEPEALAMPSRRDAPCGAQKLVMRQCGKCGVTRQAQVPRRSFDILAEGGALPRRMELPCPTSGAVASDCNR